MIGFGHDAVEDGAQVLPAKRWPHGLACRAIPNHG